MYAYTERFARCIDASKRVRWEIERDVIRGRRLDNRMKFLPDGLSCVQEAGFLNADDKRFLSQVQGRTYANVFGLAERFICAKVIELSRDYLFDNQVALEGLIRFSDEELKHQELFRRVEQMAASVMPEGYHFAADPNDVAQVVLGKGTWAVLALTCHIELFTQMHYRQSIAPDLGLSPLFKDLFLYHWKEECQHAVMDELEWRREDARLDGTGRERGVDELIELVAALDAIVCAQAEADTDYFCRHCQHQCDSEQRACIAATLKKAYRWQFIVSGVQHPHFARVLEELTTQAQRERINTALAPIMAAFEPAPVAA
ncbi:hypothetical protein GCM10011348_01120 [Marinobacterium nitratireducens]|uniref:Uncharacterized protein n=1 Tax=Marinobacterium nitratireducens TaxID=518897 RepID=A0A917Z6W7_9GAMM|nr:hypothetical protein [Marinobacterium nitratireducens]GGO75701.1 hypothetical protein GCM10011348_01120 [Marinobacterium nitratireducens]